MYVADINAKGGINGQQIKLFVYDDGGDPNQARTFGTRAIEQDGVDALLAGSTTATTMAIIPLAEDAQLPLINFAGAVQAVSPVKKWNFKTPHTDLMACEKIFEDLQKRNLTKVALISGPMLRQVDARSVHDRDRKYGIEVLHEETYQPRDSDMTPQLTNIKSKAGVQAVINPGFGQGPAIVTRNYRQLGITVPLYHGHGIGTKQFIDLATPAAAEGIRLPRQRCWSPKSSPITIRRRRSWSITKDLREQDRPAGLNLRRPHVRWPDDPGRGDAARQERRQGQGARRNREDQGLHRHRRRGEHVADRPHGPRPDGVPHAGDPQRRLDARRRRIVR
jgi:ABC-type branched-subunit amino acid transport system substrate-binding protein